MGTFSLRNQHGLEVDGLSLGGTITAIRTPDRTGRVGDIVLGMDTIEDYQRGTPFFGSIVGRYANRIAGARFELDGAEYRLTANEGKNQLHGGPEGFDKVDWTIGADATDKAVTLTHFSPDGDQGFPGDVHVEARFALGDDNALSIDFRATTSKPTHINLSHHCYFNLNGAGHGSIEDHKLTVNAAAYTPVNRSSIPTGEIRTVENTDFDFRSGAMIRPRLHSRDPQIAAAGGLDHNFILDNPNPQSLCHGATVYAPGQRAPDGTLDDGTRFAGLHRQWPRRDIERQGERVLSAMAGFALSRNIILTRPTVPTFHRPYCGLEKPFSPRIGSAVFHQLRAHQRN